VRAGANLASAEDTQASLMSNEQPDAQFWKLVDSFVKSANALSDTAPRPKVSVALLYAASRFSAFVAADSAKSRSDLVSHHEEAVQYLTGQFANMVRENLSDYEANFDKYLPGKDL
jgi:Protein of unknown function (DUF3144)